MSKRSFVEDAMFGGHREKLDRIMVQKDDATSPNTVITAPVGTLLVIHYVGNAAHKDVYVNTDGSTAWTQIHNETA